VSEKGSKAGAALPTNFYLVGVGASAGGFEPLERFFSALGDGSGAAYVVVQHLSPDFKSLMRDLLERHTSMRVAQVEDGMRCEPGCVYLIPPKKNMVLRDGCLRLFDQDLSGPRALQYPIDQFFESLAKEMRERSIAVVLSGAGSDGARGVRAINEAGGLVLVQSPETAQFDGMPRSALASGSAHSALPPDELARTVEAYVQRMGVDTPEGPIVEGAADPNVLREIVAMLRQDSTIDFTHYRTGTISRRISRRVSITGARGIEDYVRRLADDSQERAALRSDLLIGVTAFFRDGEAWKSLRRNFLEPLVANAEEGPIRCWVTACSTGEEVYTLAMLLFECLEAAGRDLDLKIFATDIDKRALETAATGVYSFSIRDEVPVDLLGKYFVQDGSSFRVSRRVRESVIFAEHNLNRDAPLTNMDLVTCRNALIYMEQELQYRVLATLHFALRVDGGLLLGAAETCGDLDPEFKCLDTRWKVYSKRRNVVLRQEGRRPTLSLMEPIRPAKRREVPRPAREVPVKEGLMVQAFRALLHGRQSACFLVGVDGELLHVFGKGALFTQVPEGAGSAEFARILREPLVLPFGTAMQKAREGGGVVRYTDIAMPPTEVGAPSLVDMSVIPATGDGGIALMIVLFEDSASVPRGEPRPFTVDDHVASRIRALEQELQQSRESLKSSVEELETANEEHQATNEELMASNEELQSTNEELQSVNEELYTVNAEHQNKIQELTDLNNDVENLLRNTPMSTMFLDAELRIRKFTPGITALVRVSMHDIGRRVTDLAHRLEAFELWQALGAVLETGTPCEEAVTAEGGGEFILRAVPYEVEHESGGGLVVTLLESAPLRRLLDQQPKSNRATRERGEAAEGAADS
jgi:chemotaxis methyl-accepting protein methylase